MGEILTVEERLDSLESSTQHIGDVGSLLDEFARARAGSSNDGGWPHLRSVRIWSRVVGDCCLLVASGHVREAEREPVPFGVGVGSRTARPMMQGATTRVVN